ncbi:Protein O-GlcNAc transferase protein [Dioscorea alata]|uniref:Protein O-GlcNAc transferase protein n=1 Tax=Dioscorea alata TaxID=55571 RepID=A0ACB7UE77_DIOAL|nr:Protein O-GlcNAc transferase protein [Dioscorea alata]
MGYEAKLIRSFSNVEPKKLGFGLLFACLMVSIAYISITKPYEQVPFSSVSSRLSSVRINPVITVSMNSRALDGGSENAANQTAVDVKEKENIITLHQSSVQNHSDEKQEEFISCNVSNQRSNTCEMNGDIRIHGTSSSVELLISDRAKTNQSWRIKPYARKQDNVAMANVREVSLKTSHNDRKLLRCNINHTAPAIIFSIGGYTGNFFHDFTDVLVPLFLTSHQFNGEVHFLVTNMRSWWINKYSLIFKKLSKYQVIDFDKDDKLRCFPKAIIGLRSHKELSIDSTRSPNNYTMLDFTKFMRSTYSLERETPIKYSIRKHNKPRLLIICRRRTRRFTNVNKITKMAEKLGFEVVVGEADSRTSMEKFAWMVNSCDVMMGVHGAGLTNLVFLPTNAILIQVVPWGNLDWISRSYFKEPAMDMKLRYLEYRISEEESTLMEVYPKDHPVFKDPFSIHKLGWNSIKDVFLDKQDVKLNVRRFRGVLVKALKLLHS